LFASRLAERLMQLLTRTASAGSDVAQGCFKALTALMRTEGHAGGSDGDGPALTTAQLTKLISILKPELETGSAASTSTSFALLRVIVGRRLICEVRPLTSPGGRCLLTERPRPHARRRRRPSTM
jgi:hypothetical protein